MLDDKVDPAKAAADAIAAHLPEGLKVREPADRARLGRDVFLNAEQGLRFAGALTMTLAVFIILNTFMMNVSERKRQLAILRTIGATRGQIERMMLCEALLMGVVGTIAGIPLGLWGAKFLLAGLALLRASPAPQLQWTMEPFLLAAGIGPGMALLARLPSRKAGRQGFAAGRHPGPGFVRQPAGFAVDDAGRHWRFYGVRTACGGMH